METPTKCPICQADARQARELHARAADRLLRCRACQSLFSSPRYTRDELQELYRREYYGPQVADPNRADLQTHAQELHRTVLKVLHRRCPQIFVPGANVLDFGCGYGYFLAQAQQLGLQATGVEISPDAAAHARDRLGLNVLTGDEAALDRLGDGQFMLVNCAQVIEHLLEPRDVLGKLVDKLAPGGILMLAFPNIRCWRYRIEGGRWFNVANPTHLNFFTLSAVRQILTDLGLTDVHRLVFWGGRSGFGPLANFAQYLVRWINLGSDVRLIARKP